MTTTRLLVVLALLPTCTPRRGSDAFCVTERCGVCDHDAGNDCSQACAGAPDGSPCGEAGWRCVAQVCTDNELDASPVPDRVIFEESFDTGRLAPERWLVEGPAADTLAVPLAGNDHALRLAGDGRYENGCRSLWPFARGGNLTVTFKTWHDGAFQYSTVAGPWHASPSTYAHTGDYPFLRLEAGLSGQEQGVAAGPHLQWAEGSHLWAWRELSVTFLERWLSASGKDRALHVRVQLGDVTGARAAWSSDGVTFYALKAGDGAVLDTTGLTAGSPADAASGNSVSSSPLVWLGFGGGYGAPVYVDDIVVRRDATAEPRELATWSDIMDPLEQATTAPRGWYYSDEVPDTLDLAERVALAVHGLTAASADCPDGSPWYCAAGFLGAIAFGQSPIDFGPPFFYTVKHARTLPLLRAASGSTENLAIDTAYMKYAVNSAWYEHPARQAYPYMAHSEGVAASALYNWFFRDLRPEYLVFTRFLADGLRASALQAGDRAFFPPSSGRDPDTGSWSTTAGWIPYVAPEEPWIDQLGNEGSVKWGNALVLRALVRDAIESRSAASLETARALARFLTKAELWDRDPAGPSCATSADFRDYCPDYSKVTEWTGFVPSYPGNVHGTHSGQSHGNLNALQALLDLALATGDAALSELVRRGLDHAIATGLPLLGWVPYWQVPASWGRESLYTAHAETGGLGDVVGLAVMVSSAGLGDYWDFIDRAVRNSLAEAQLTDLERLRAISDGASDAELLRLRGLFSNAVLPTEAIAHTAGDADVNAAMGLYYAWDAIMTYDNDTARVNLPLNRAARWGDVHSYLPNLGHVAYVNRWARRVMIRIPGFVTAPQADVTVRVDGQVVTDFTWSGRYVVVDGLGRGTSVGVSFSVPESTTALTWNDTSYSATVRGHTVVVLTKNGPDGGPTIAQLYETYPLNQRGTVESHRAMPPIETVTRFVSDRRYPLQLEPFVGIYR